MTCVTFKAGNRHTLRHHQRETSALESARQNRYTNSLHTASAERRHAFASAMLGKGVPITDVAHWLGHRDVRVTYRIYGHLVPSAAARAIAVLDEEYAEWSKPEKKK